MKLDCSSMKNSNSANMGSYVSTKDLSDSLFVRNVKFFLKQVEVLFDWDVNRYILVYVSSGIYYDFTTPPCAGKSSFSLF